MSVSCDESNGFVCQWDIRNFTFSLGFSDFTSHLASPRFVVNLVDATNWILKIDLKKDMFENGFHCYLKRISDDGPDVVQLNYDISILDGDGFFKRIAQETSLSFYKNSTGYPYVSSTSFVDGKDIMGLLKENTLTIRCHIWNDEIIEPMQWFLRTRLETQKRTSKVSIDINKSSFHKQLTTSLREDELALFVNFSWTEESLTGQILQIQINQVEYHIRWQVTGVVFVLDLEGNPAVSQRGEFHFNAEDMADEIWTFPPFLSKKWILDNKDTCLTTGRLNLLFEFEMSNGNTIDEVERINFGFPVKKVDEGMNRRVKHHGETSSPLKSGILTLYQKQKFCDMTIQTGSASYPAHKVILCAQSSVFASMFEQDMEENETGVVLIPDLTDDTVQKMLLFMYTGTVEDLRWESAYKLYLAADKYDIVGLKHACKTFLKVNLSVATVADALLLADYHHEEDLKSVLYDFILESGDKVIASDMWQKFMKEHTELAGETLRLLYLRKCKI